MEKLTVRLLALQPLKQLVILCMSANPEPVNVIILQQAKNAVSKSAQLKLTGEGCHLSFVIGH
ncbi:MAG: hypothetical protein V7K27_16415 [Nostoc sp.]